MAELKTKKNATTVAKYVASIKGPVKHADTRKLLALFRSTTNEKPVMWGESIVGFGEYHYVYASGREGDWPMTGFSARAQNLTIYIMPGFKDYKSLLKKIGPHKVGSSCLYIKRLSDIHLPALKKLVSKGFQTMQKSYGNSS